MPKDIIPAPELQLHQAMTLLQRLMAQASQTDQTTTAIQLTVEDLRPLLALLARPEGQELELGQRLEETLATIGERLGKIEASLVQSHNWHKEHNARLVKLEAAQSQIRDDLARLHGDLFSDADLSAP